jgi:hypothetical protein
VLLFGEGLGGAVFFASSIARSAAGLVLCGAECGRYGGCFGGLCLNQLIVSPRKKAPEKGALN